jgi:hypothetical protein
VPPLPPATRLCGYTEFHDAGVRNCRDQTLAGYFDQAHFGHEFRAFTGLTPTRYVEVRRRFLREHPATRWSAGRCRPIDFLQERKLTTR